MKEHILKPYQCNYCKTRYYTMDGVINCSCKLNRKVKWNAPGSRTREIRALMEWRG